jgi:hypothetical protein
MTTQTTIRESTGGVRSLLAATAFTAVALAGAALWLVRPGGQEAAPAAGTSVSTASDGAIPMGGLAERFREAQRAEAAREAAGTPDMGGLAERYRDQERAQSEREGARLPPRGGLVEQYPEDQRALATAETTLGGLAELYAEQAARATTHGIGDGCGARVGPAEC